MNKRLLLARLTMAVGMHRIVGAPPPRSLLVVNYHRLRRAGQAGPTSFDDGVFDTDVETFRRQMRWLKEATVVLDEEALLAAASGKELPLGKLYSAVTFDDGYVDCYTLAKPVLDQLGIRAIFFMPVRMLESRMLGWWDIAAYLLKRSKRQSIVVDGETYDIEADFHGSLRRVLELFKLQSADRTAALLEKLVAACGVPAPEKDAQSAELMTWPQVREMRAAGHGIGSHTLSHRVLATLAADEQEREIKDSRRELEAIIGSRVVSFAYPVGGPQHITGRSVELAREAGYEQAFTFKTGMTSFPLQDRYRVPRESATSFAMLKAKARLPGLMGL